MPQELVHLSFRTLHHNWHNEPSCKLSLHEEDWRSLTLELHELGYVRVYSFFCYGNLKFNKPSCWQLCLAWSIRPSDGPHASTSQCRCKSRYELRTYMRISFPHENIVVCHKVLLWLFSRPAGSSPQTPDIKLYFPRRHCRIEARPKQFWASSASANNAIYSHFIQWEARYHK